MPRFIQCPKTRKLIPAEEYHRHEATQDRAAYVQEDIKAFRSPIDGKMVNSRSDLRDHNRKHGVTDPRDYGPNWFKSKEAERQAEFEGTSKKAKQSRVETIQRAMHKHGIS